MFLPVNPWLLQRQNILLVVASNKNLFQDDIHKADDHDLVSRSRIQSGDFDHKTLVNLEPVEDQDKVGNVVITEPTFGADGFSPV